MELRQLERFLAVFDHGTLAAAARELDLTQQALSASLSTLEHDLEVRLFNRAPGGITRPTAYGETLVSHARSQLAADRRARLDLDNLRDAQSGTVTIGIGETFAGDILEPAVTRLLAERPKLRINLIEGYSEKILERLYDGEFDFVAVGVGGFTLRDGFHAEPIYTANDVVACRPGHPLTKEPNLALADLVGYDWMVPYSRPSDRDAIIDAFVAEDLPPPGRFIGSDAYRIGMKLLLANDFLSMTSPALLMSRLVRDGYGVRLLPVDKPTVKRNASLVSNSDRPMTPAAEALLDAVRIAAANYKAVVT